MIPCRVCGLSAAGWHAQLNLFELEAKPERLNFQSLNSYTFNIATPRPLRLTPGEIDDHMARPWPAEGPGIHVNRLELPLSLVVPPSKHEI